MTMYEFEDSGNRVSLEEMMQDVADILPYDDEDSQSVTAFAIWLNNTFTAWDVAGMSMECLIKLWVGDLACKDPDELYANTGYREVRA